MELSRRLGNGLLTGVVALCALAATPLAAQQAGGTPRTKIDVSKLGPQVGQTVPNFSLSDQTGKVWTRASIMGPKGALLLFYRSADWCPYCKTQLIDLQSRLGELRAKGLGVAAISYDPVPTLAEFASRKLITFPLLSDAGSATIRAFGILNPMPEMAFGPDKDAPPSLRSSRNTSQADGRIRRGSGLLSRVRSSSIRRARWSLASSRTTTSSGPPSRTSC